MNFEISFDEIGEIADILGSLEFVTCDHHDSYASFLKTSNSLRDSVLEFVFNCSCSEYVKFALGFFNECKFDFFDFLRRFDFVKFIVGDYFLGLMEFCILFLGHFAITKH